MKEDFRSSILVPIGFFYLGQGFSLGSMVLLLPQYMVHVLKVPSEGDAATIAAIILVPWYFKIIFGILSDNVSVGRWGRRRPYMFFAAILGVIGWTSLPLHSSANIGFILSGFSLSVGSALSDAVLDAQSVELTPKKYTGRLQGIAWGSRGIGLGFAGYVSTSIVEYVGWNPMFYTAGFFGVSITLVALLLPQRKVATSQSLKKGFYSIVKIFEDLGHQSKTRTLFFLFSGMTLGTISIFTFIMSVDLGYTTVELGVGSLVFAIFNGVGSFLMGIIFDHKETEKRILGLHLFTLTCITTGFLVLQFPLIDFVDFWDLSLFYIAAIGAGLGGYEAFQLKIIQESSPEDVEGTAFALWTGFSNIGQFVFGGAVLANITEFTSLSFIGVSILTLIPLALGLRLALQIHRDKYSEMGRVEDPMNHSPLT